MRAYFDTEYVMKGKKAIFASIAIVRDDGQTLHLVSRDLDPDCGGWYFKRKVWKHMGGVPRATVPEIADAVREILRGVTFLACRDGGLDLKVLTELIGPVPGVYCNLQRMWESVGQPVLPERIEQRHHALEDAEWHKTMFEFLLQYITQPQLVAA